jgi:hypothetical protein
MSEIEDGGSAFPSEYYANAGMSLRDYFAAAALQGLIQASAMPMFDDFGQNQGMPTDSAHEAIINGPGISDPKSHSPSSSLAWVAYGYADAMIEARKETQP